MDSVWAFLKAVCELVVAIFEICADLLALATLIFFWYVFF